MKNLLFTLVLLTTAYLIPVCGQRHIIFTQNWLDNVSQSTCMQRSKEILQRNNFSVIQPDDQISSRGEKNDWKVVLTCQPCGDKTITTIMLSTNLSDAIAVELREQMLYYIANGKEMTNTVTGICSWIDGQDNTQQSDPGRGVTNWNAHYSAVNNYGSDDLAERVKNRLITLAGCLQSDNYAKVYADVSVVIADYGVRFANWKNDLTNSVLGDDIGCGYKDWNAHYNAVNNYGSGDLAERVKNRLALLARTLPGDNFAKLYADVSVKIATYGTTK